MTKFTTGREDGDGASKHVGDAYFLESNDKIRFFFEEGVYLPICHHESCGSYPYIPCNPVANQ
jgi:hypothetical protein